MKMPGNMQAMMQQTQKMQQKMQEEIALIRVEASAGGGIVTVKMDGQKRCLGVTIDPEAAGDADRDAVRGQDDATLELHPDALGEQGAARSVGAGQEEQELLAAPAAGQVGLTDRRA